MNHKIVRVTLTIFGFATLVLFQNCSDVNFSAQPAESAAPGALVAGFPVGGSTDPFVDTSDGLSGGHFDLDTSTAVYPLGAGKTNHHVHEFDDKFHVTYADFFHLPDPKYDDITEAVSQSTRFVLIIANAQLSTKGVLSINGTDQSVVDYQSKVRAFINGDASALPVFTLDGSSGAKLSSLRIGFPVDSILNGGLIGTATGCVVGNDPGKLGEYRNGALTIQAIDVSTLKLDSTLGVAQPNGGLLWESTIFYHWDNGCYK